MSSGDSATFSVGLLGRFARRREACTGKGPTRSQNFANIGPVGTGLNDRAGETAQGLIKWCALRQAEDPWNIRRGERAIGRDRQDRYERLDGDLFGEMTGRSIQRNQCHDVFLIDRLYQIG